MRDPILMRITEALSDARWTFAKTMPQWPHEYTLRKHWRADVPFEDVVQFIRDHGYSEVFEPTGKEMTYLDIGGHKYWTMGAPLPQTILINRERIAGEFVTTGPDGRRVDGPMLFELLGEEEGDELFGLHYLSLLERGWTEAQIKHVYGDLYRRMKARG